MFLEELFEKVEFIDSTKDEAISENSDVVYICGGYVETTASYNKIKTLRILKTLL